MEVIAIDFHVTASDASPSRPRRSSPVKTTLYDCAGSTASHWGDSEHVQRTGESGDTLRSVSQVLSECITLSDQFGERALQLNMVGIQHERT